MGIQGLNGDSFPGAQVSQTECRKGLSAVVVVKDSDRLSRARFTAGQWEAPVSQTRRPF